MPACSRVLLPIPPLLLNTLPLLLHTYTSLAGGERGGDDILLRVNRASSKVSRPFLEKYEKQN